MRFLSLLTFLLVLAGRIIAAPPASPLPASRLNILLVVSGDLRDTVGC